MRRHRTRKQNMPEVTQALVPLPLGIFYVDPGDTEADAGPEGWLAMPLTDDPDGPQPFEFAGDREEEQLENVQILATAMSTGEPEAVDGIITDIFQDLPPQFIEAPEQVTNILFETTHQLDLAGQTIFATTEVIIDELDAAGAALLTALGIIL